MAFVHLLHSAFWGAYACHAGFWHLHTDYGVSMELEDGRLVRLDELLEDVCVDDFSAEQWQAVEGELAWHQLQRAMQGGPASGRLRLTADQVWPWCARADVSTVFPWEPNPYVCVQRQKR